MPARSRAMLRGAAALACALSAGAVAVPQGEEVEWVLGSAGASCTDVCKHQTIHSVGCREDSFNLTLEEFGDVLERIMVGPISSLCSSISDGGSCYDPSYDSGRCGRLSCDDALKRCDAAPSSSTARRFCPCKLSGASSQPDASSSSSEGGKVAKDVADQAERAAMLRSMAQDLSNDNRALFDESASAAVANAQPAQPAQAQPASDGGMTEKQQEQLIGGVVGGTVGVVTVGLLGGLLGGLLTTSTTGVPIAPPTTTSLTVTTTSAQLRSLATPGGASWLGASAANVTGAVHIGAPGQVVLAGSWLWWIAIAAAVLSCLCFVILFAFRGRRGRNSEPRRRSTRALHRSMGEDGDDSEAWPDSPSGEGSPRFAAAPLLDDPDAWQDPRGKAPVQPERGNAVQRLQSMRPWGLPKLQPIAKVVTQELGSSQSVRMASVMTRAGSSFFTPAWRDWGASGYAPAPQMPGQGSPAFPAAMPMSPTQQLFYP